MGLLEERHGMTRGSRQPYAHAYTGALNPSDRMPWGISMRADPRPAQHMAPGNHCVHRMVQNSPLREVLDLVTNVRWCIGTDGGEDGMPRGTNRNRPDVYEMSELAGHTDIIKGYVHERLVDAATGMTENFAKDHLWMRPGQSHARGSIAGRHTDAPVPDAEFDQGPLSLERPRRVTRITLDERTGEAAEEDVIITAGPVMEPEVSTPVTVTEQAVQADTVMTGQTPR